jgi:hypothetical protein
MDRRLHERNLAYITLKRKLRGHPLAGRSSRHRPSRGEEFLFLLPSYQLVSVWSSRLRAPVFNRSVSDLVRTSHPSGSRLWSDPFKDLISCPWHFCAPENCRYHAVSKVIGFTDPLAHPVRGPTQLWLTAWAYHLIKSSPSCLVFRDGTAANQASWL